MNPPLIRRTVIAVVLAAAAVLGSVLAVSAASPAAPFCGITWGSLAKSSGTLSPAGLLDARTGQHDCYDRLVFDFNRPASGYTVAYVDQVTGQGRGLPLNVAGGARLGVLLLATDSDMQTGAQTYPRAV